MKFDEALTALIDQQYEKSYNRESRDVIAVSATNIRIANDVMGEQGVGNEFYRDPEVEDAFGVFDNNREYGITVTYRGWMFTAYEHRNSDDVCVEGCRVEDVQSWGPYGGEDKHDVLYATKWLHNYEAGYALVAAMHYVEKHPKATRDELKKVMKEAKSPYA